MKEKTHVGNITLVVRWPTGKEPELLLGLKRPKKKSDAKRKRKKVGSGLWVPTGGGTEAADRSQKHSAQRELLQESRLFFPLKSFKKVGTLRGYFGSTKRPHWLVHVYLVITDDPNLTAVPNEEYTKMGWFTLAKLPWKKMLEGDRDWLLRAAQGQKLAVEVFFDQSGEKLIAVVVRRIASFN